MLKIILNKKYKSLNPPCEFELPEFSVITGKNGSGKTHLLEAIADSKISQVFKNGVSIRNIKYIGFNGLNPVIAESCDPLTLTQFTKDTWNVYSNYLKSILQTPAINHNLKRLLDLIPHNKEDAKKFISKTTEQSKKPFDQLTEDDFVDNFDTSFFGQKEFFTAQFALIFKFYHRAMEENNYNEFMKTKGQLPSKPVLSKNEFENKFGIPPWDFVNNLLKETNIPYEVNNPIGTRIDSNFVFKLKDRVGGFEISSIDLSTGEKVLLSLALAIYNTGGNSGKPDLLIIDEPDAPLHPSMSKMVVDVLTKNIVRDNKIPVIISTHSPTTIIATEGISIYQMIRGNSLPKKIATQEAVEFLSSDIPFLRISNEKRRQVFVESKYDANYYELITNIYSRLMPLPAEPIYIPARTSNGSNCSDVIETVTNLSNNGNREVYGIIDWDTVNKSNDRVLVLGENDRYSIENYLLDPLLMGLLFIRERKIDFSHFALNEFTSYSEVDKLTQIHAQQITNKVLLDLGLQTSNLCISVRQNDWKINISKEFGCYQGHDLETLYKSKYHFLNAYRNEDSLKKDVIKKVINDHPQFTPIQIFEVIKNIK
jgi:predicted ATPase